MAKTAKSMTHDKASAFLRRRRYPYGILRTEALYLEWGEDLAKTAKSMTHGNLMPLRDIAHGGACRLYSKPGDRRRRMDIDDHVSISASDARK